MPRIVPAALLAVAASATAGGLSAAGVLAPLPAAWIAAGAGAALAGYAGAGSVLPSWCAYGPALTRGRLDRPRVALTFDDGPDPASTPILLAALRTAGARATFFVLADRACRFPDLLADLARDQEVALHGGSHDLSLVFLPPAAGAARLREACALLASLPGGPRVIRWFRPPFGAQSPRSVAAVRLAGLATAWCSVRTRDGLGGDPGRVRRACARAGPGDVVLLHEGARPARDALPSVLGDLSRRGLTASTLSEVVDP